jgi:hypothetical protein
MKIQQTRHGNRVFLQVLKQMSMSRVGATDKPIFKRPKKPL